MTEYTRAPGDPIHTQNTQFEPGRSQQMEQAGDSTERHGTYEPDDSRNVTGAAGAGVGAPGGSDQQTGGERWGGQQMGQTQTPNAAGEVEQSGQMNQFDSSQGGQMGGQQGEIREHMEVIGADGVHLGTVDKVEDGRIKLTKADSPSGHQDHHHYISRGLVAGVEGDKVRLSAAAANAYAMEEEQ